MPANAPPIRPDLVARIQALGEQIRAHRLGQGVSAAATAEAAGLSRVTLHRIERGEPSVTLGDYVSVMDALGMPIGWAQAEAAVPARPVAPLRGPRRPMAAPAPTLPAPGAPPPGCVRVADYPQLAQLAWHLPGSAELTPAEALSLYERNWRHVDAARLSDAERQLVDRLVQQVGQGLLLV